MFCWSASSGETLGWRIRGFGVFGVASHLRDVSKCLRLAQKQHRSSSDSAPTTGVGTLGRRLFEISAAIGPRGSESWTLLAHQSLFSSCATRSILLAPFIQYLVFNHFVSSASRKAITSRCLKVLQHINSLISHTSHSHDVT